MRDGVCPKCKSRDVRSGLQWSRNGKDRIPLGNMITGAPIDIYVCASCGYVETYISDERSLREIAKYWPRMAGDKLKPEQKPRHIRPYTKRKRLSPLTADLFETDEE